MKIAKAKRLMMRRMRYDVRCWRIGGETAWKGTTRAQLRMVFSRPNWQRELVEVTWEAEVEQ